MDKAGIRMDKKKRLRLKKPYYFLVAGLLVAAMIIAFILLYDQKDYQIRDRNVELELGETLNRKIAYYVNGEKEVLKEIKLDFSKVKADKLGSYKIALTYKDNKDTITIDVVDTQKPTIKLKEDKLDCFVNQKLQVEDLVESVEDASKVSLSFKKDKVKTTYTYKKAGKKTLSVYAIDEAKNVSEAKLKATIKKDKEAPVLNGVEDGEIALNGDFNALLGVSAMDNCDGDITSSIKVNGSVDAAKEGTYVLTYAISDKAGNKSEIQRTITVIKKAAIQEYTLSQGSASDDLRNEMMQKVSTYLGSDISKVGISYYDIESGNSFTINGDAQFISASTIKVPTVLALYDLVDGGSVSLSETMSYNGSSDYEGGTGVMQNGDLSQPFTLAYLSEVAITTSDNIAFHMLWRRMSGSYVFRAYEQMIGHSTNWNITSMSANDGTAVMKKLYSGNSGTYEKLKKDLKNTIFNDRISKYLPAGITAHKIGDNGGLVHDFGIVYAKHPYILSVYSNNMSGAHDKIANVSKIIYDLQTSK